MITAGNHKRLRAPQKRQIDRVNLLLDCAADLLKTKSLDELSLADISKKTGIALPSIYYYYPNKNELLVALAQKISSKWIKNAHKFTEEVNWQELIKSSTEGGANYLNKNPYAMKVLLSYSSPFEAKIANNLANKELAHELVKLFGRLYCCINEEDLQPHMEIYLSLLDGIWQTSYNQHIFIPPQVINEAKIAVVSYLRNYLPETLPFKKTN